MTEIRRQADTHNPHGVVRPESPPVLDDIQLRVQYLGPAPGGSGGRLRFTTPLARGWVRVADDPEGIAKALAEARLEVQLARYAAARGEEYDLDVDAPPSELHPLTAALVPRDRGDIYDPQAWTPMPDGRWRSPSGRMFGADTQVVQRVKARRTPPP
jgi:hypothetical protein